MARKPRLDEDVSDVNIMPLMNIIMLLIPFLIMSTEFIKIGVINVSAPKIGGAPSQSDPANKPKKKPLNLTVQVSKKGLTVMTQNQKLPEGCNLADLRTPGAKKFPTIKKSETNKHNYKELTRCLVKIKKAFPDERRLIIMADPEIPYHVIIQLMDSSRESPDAKSFTKQEQSNLFPEVVISAGVV